MEAVVIQRAIQFTEDVTMLTSIGGFFLAVVLWCLGIDPSRAWAFFFASLGVFVLTITRPIIQSATAAIRMRAK